MITDLIQIICKAANEVTENYLKLATTYELSGIVRERVFCYEFYHQLRVVLGNDQKLTLNGEIDKRGHTDFKEEDRKNPDFVFHIPGGHDGNTLILEVKGKLDIDDIIKDFDTITTFVSSYNYQAGVFFLYNHTLEELLEKFNSKFDKFVKSECSEKIFVITLPKARSIGSVISLKELESKIIQK